ncbi:MAG: YebC/PmpR family DNA-binding transcriptional regulator [Deltaproteobacteria bacterium]|nr:YebC/PmpR family DNA-binding transcriptional regulator [Deltaproteobacteria bacterium]
MSGHSKWATIKRKKGATDAKRGKLFSKLVKEITIAARMGGGDPGANPRLRTAVDAARAASMPSDNVARAIKKGTGELEGAMIEEITYEGYGPGGVAMLIESTTDNKNRTVAEIRHILGRHGGHLGETGSVGWVFQKKGLIVVDKTAASEEKLIEIALEAGAEDIQDQDSEFHITTAPHDLENVKKVLATAKINLINAEISMVPQNYMKLNEAESERMLKLMEALEDHDDVNKVYANFDIPDEILNKLSNA